MKAAVLSGCDGIGWGRLHQLFISSLGNRQREGESSAIRAIKGETNARFVGRRQQRKMGRSRRHEVLVRGDTRALDEVSTR